MVMVVFDITGYWRICSLYAAMPPTSRMSRLTTLASTGRRMKRSVKAFIGASRAGGHGGGRQRRLLVDRHRRVRLRLDLAGGDDALARLDPLLDCDPLALHGADPNESSLDDQPPCAGLAGLRRGLHHEDVVAIKA